MRNAFADEVTSLAANDPRIVLLSGDIGNRLFDNLRSQSPKQFINCGIAEANMMSVAAGMGLTGLRPIVYTITPFTTIRCLEQIKVGVAYHESPVIIVGTGAGLSYASLGPTHHSLEDFAILRAIPNLQILAPWDSISLRFLLRSALISKLPSYIRIGKKGEIDLTSIGSVAPIGGTVCIRSGTDLCIIAVGTIASEAIKAADALSMQGVSTEVVLLHTIKPFPESEFDKLLKRHSRIMIVEEHSTIGGFGEACLAYAARQPMNSKIVTLGAKDKFMPFVGTQEFARSYFEINYESIVKGAFNLFNS